MLFLLLDTPLVLVSNKRRLMKSLISFVRILAMELKEVTIEGDGRSRLNVPFG